uniref:Proline-serine-threonine phosphatase interacting protein 1b n=1 Tax=Tetraodon nigroviridis TaxID=99883 RepID=H3D1B7_TETNG
RMTLLMFKDSFWGCDFTNHAGYEAVIRRLQDGRQMCKDVEELLKMLNATKTNRFRILTQQILRRVFFHISFVDLKASFEEIKSQLENIGNFHIQLSDTLKEEVKKIEVFRERQKEQKKKFQSIMEKIQRKKVSLYKKTMESRKNYQLRCKEADEAEQTAQKTNLAAKNSDKIRHRANQCRQNAIEAEKLHSSTIVSLESVRKDWEEAHKSTCEVFQQLEMDRIAVLRCALWDHCNYLSVQCVKDDEKQSYEEVRRKLEKCDIITDINCFIRMKSTGTKPPEPVLFESCYEAGRSTNDNHQAPSADWDHLARFGSICMSTDHLAPEPMSISTDSLQMSQSSSLNDTGDTDAGYAPLRFGRSQAEVSADEERYSVMFDYKAQEIDELSVSTGETVQVLEQGQDGWWMVAKNGMKGLVPGNYLKKI